MPPLKNVIIKDYVGGDDLSVVRTVANIQPGRTMTKAWLTIKAKAKDADPGLVQKIITTAPQAGIGQITDAGGSGTGTLLFLLTPTDTQTTLVVGRKYAFDTQVKFDDGTIATLERSEPDGYIEFEQGVTAAVS